MNEGILVSRQHEGLQTKLKDLSLVVQPWYWKVKQAKVII